MKKINTILSVALASLAFYGCGKDDSSNTSQESKPTDTSTVETTAATIDPNTTLSGTLKSSSKDLSGTGTVVFNAPLSGTSSKSSYALTFSLEDGGNLTLHSNSTSTVTQSIGVRFRRTGSALIVDLVVGGTEVDVSPQFASVNAATAVSVQIDVHNDETPAHLLIWTDSDFSEGTATLNSEDDGLSAPGNGSGQYWGLVLSNATVTQAKVGAPKFVE